MTTRANGQNTGVVYSGDSVYDWDVSTTLQKIRFPPISEADEDGLLMVGGELSVEWLLAGYRQGIFPWPMDEADEFPLPWWCPDPRAIIELDRFHVSRRLAETIRSGTYIVTRDEAFADVIEGCAQPRGDGDMTWITPQLKRAFIELYELGHAHSVECWRAGELAGGVYGLAIGGFFSAESMFFRRRDASKVALAHLVEHLRQHGFELLDVQMWTEHTGRMGATEIPRDDFLRSLERATALSVRF